MPYFEYKSTLPVSAKQLFDWHNAPGAFDRIQQAGGFISVNTSGNTQDANSIPIEKENADNAFDAYRNATSQ